MYEDDNPAKINRFLQRKPASIPVALDPGTSYFELSRKLNNNGRPLLLVIDQREHIRFYKDGFEIDDQTRRELHSQINALLAAR
jgi:hypothetical protein